MKKYWIIYNKCKNRKSGFTLLELLIAMMVSMIVIMGVAQFMVASTNSYRYTNEEVNMQHDAQDTLNLVCDVIMEGYNISQNEGLYSVYIGSKEQKIFGIDKKGNLVMYHVTKTISSDLANQIKNATPLLVAENVSSFGIKQSGGSQLPVGGYDSEVRKPRVTVSIKFNSKVTKTKSMAKFDASQDAVIRNMIRSVS